MVAIAFDDSLGPINVRTKDGTKIRLTSEEDVQKIAFAEAFQAGENSHFFKEETHFIELIKSSTRLMLTELKSAIRNERIFSRLEFNLFKRREAEREHIRSVKQQTNAELKKKISAYQNPYGSKKKQEKLLKKEKKYMEAVEASKNKLESLASDSIFGEKDAAVLIYNQICNKRIILEEYLTFLKNQLKQVNEQVEKSNVGLVNQLRREKSL
ncbi:MAG TPA: hypothetical protein ENN46_04630 [Candidatus Woesearchaeota archaeon]|nr:hypothetical protein [Candidatus Woesearchaeota archaeon]